MKNEVAGWTNESFMEDNRGKMAVFFHAVQVRNNFKSDAEKRPIFEERIFIKKLVPGESPQLPCLRSCKELWQGSPLYRLGQILPTWFHATKGLPHQS